MTRGQRLQGANLTLDSLSAFAIAFINHEDVGNFHDAGFDGLHIIAHAGDKNHDGDIGEPHDIDFILADAYGFDHDRSRPEASSTVATSAVARASPPSDPRVAMLRIKMPGSAEMILHADAVAKNRAARVGTGWIDRDDADAAVLLLFMAIVLGKLIDQRALARSGRASQANGAGVAGIRE